MTNSIQSLSNSAVSSLSSVPSNKPSEGASSFKDMLMSSINDVNQLQQDANRAVENLATGEDVSPAEVLTAVQKADVAFRMMMQVRNKLIQAYQEVQNIRV